VNKKVQKQLAELIANTPSLTAEPAPKVSTKKAMKWALKKFGAEGVYADGERSEKQAKRWAVEQYVEYKASKKAKPSSDGVIDMIAKTNKDAIKANDAMEALASGAVKRKAAKAKKDEAKAKAEAQTRDTEISTAFTALKLSLDEQLKNATLNFINGPVKDVMDSFVKLFTSRSSDGESDEAVLALDACKKAFDACGLILADVETKSKKKAKVSTEKAPPETAKDAKRELRHELREFVNSKTKKRKPLTEKQREAKNKKDRERRAAKSKKGAK